MNPVRSLPRTGTIAGVRTELPSKEFRWNGSVLEQKVQVIQHRASETRDIGIYQEWHPVGVRSEPVARRCGRTTRMLTEALELISDRREVLIVTDNERHANHLRMAIDEIACKCGLLSKPSESHLLSFISPSTPHFDWQRLHLIGKSRHTTVLVDHYTIEARFAPMLKMLHRYDNPLP